MVISNNVKETKKEFVYITELEKTESSRKLKRSEKKKLYAMKQRTKRDQNENEKKKRKRKSCSV